MIYETLLREGADAIAQRLPPTWQVSCDTESEAPTPRVTICAPDGSAASLQVEARRRIPVGAIPEVCATKRDTPAAAVLAIAGWLSPRSREALTKAGISYVDLTGNIELRLTRPGLYVRMSGAEHDPEPASAALSSLKGAGAARAVRALVDFLPPCGVRQLAQVSGATAPVLSRVLALLEHERLVTRGRGGQIETVAWAEALRRWGEDYRLLRTHRAVPLLEPRGVQALLRKLPSFPERWAATGTLGVPLGATVVPLQLPTLYVDAPERVAAALGLRSVASGANVVLVAPVDPGVYARSTRGEDGIVRCAPSQVYADLRTGAGRGSAEAEALLGWMEANESLWRTRL
jgi:hypothetical protein